MHEKSCDRSKTVHAKCCTYYLLLLLLAWFVQTFCDNTQDFSSRQNMVLFFKDTSEPEVNLHEEGSFILG